MDGVSGSYFGEEADNCPPPDLSEFEDVKPLINHEVPNKDKFKEDFMCRIAILNDFISQICPSTQSMNEYNDLQKGVTEVFDSLLQNYDFVCKSARSRMHLISMCLEREIENLGFKEEIAELKRKNQELEKQISSNKSVLEVTGVSGGGQPQQSTEDVQQNEVQLESTEPIVTVTIPTSTIDIPVAVTDNSENDATTTSEVVTPAPALGNEFNAEQLNPRNIDNEDSNLPTGPQNESETTSTTTLDVYSVDVNINLAEHANSAVVLDASFDSLNQDKNTNPCELMDNKTIIPQSGNDSSSSADDIRIEPAEPETRPRAVLTPLRRQRPKLINTVLNEDEDLSSTASLSLSPSPDSSISFEIPRKRKRIFTIADLDLPSATHPQNYPPPIQTTQPIVLSNDCGRLNIRKPPNFAVNFFHRPH